MYDYRKLPRAPLSEQHVYLMSDGRNLKIGKAVDVAARRSELQTGNAEKVNVLAVVPFGGSKLESRLHRELRAYRKMGEWFEDCDIVRAEFLNHVR